MNNLMQYVNPLFKVKRQIDELKKNPNQMGMFLKNAGMIDDSQLNEIQKMGGNYSQIGQYLISNGKMPSNYQQYQNNVSQVQQYMNNQKS